MKKSLKDYDFQGKTVIVRCDLNVPLDGRIIKDETRIEASIKTLKYLIKNNAKIIILSHLGKVTSNEDKIKNSLYPVFLKLKEKLNTNVYFCPETRGDILDKLVENIKERDVLLVENTRYEDYPDKLESNCDPELSQYWANLADIFVNDAYGSSHRAHASTVGIPKLIPSAVGFLVEKEIKSLDNILKEKTNPFIVIMGGKKISDKTLVIDSLITKCDKILIGGGMCFTFLKAKGYEVGSSIVDDENIFYCQQLLLNYPDKIILPIDIITKENKVKDIDKLSKEDIGYDIGPKTVELFKKNLQYAKRVIINGPMGVFEEPNFQKGTKEIFECLKENEIKTLVGGGDSAAAVNLLGYKDTFYHVSTGGGATLEYLSGKNLPGIDVIEDK